MKAFIAMIHRELLEHRGAFLVAPLGLVAILAGATILAFTVGRVDARMSGQLMTMVPLRIAEVGLLGLAFAWLLYLMGTLFFYCADGFSADRRNNAMLFWKSMPMSDFRVLLSKLAATLTIFPGMIFAVSLLSGLLLVVVITVTTQIASGTGLALIGGLLGSFVQVALASIVVLVLGLLWCMPFMAAVGSLASVVGRWAIPLSLLLPTLLSVLEWVTFGGLSPVHTHTWKYLSYRFDFPLVEGYLQGWFNADLPFSAPSFATDLLGRIDWPQMAVGWGFSLLAIYLASEYRRRRNDN
ncbi:hypothetical protein [Devosia sp.]|uniref:hypothetical protein n=1 Tax=Devosia sp. TaxID=1871048 RepID=UPI00326760C0